MSAHRPAMLEARTIQSATSSKKSDTGEKEQLSALRVDQLGLFRFWHGLTDRTVLPLEAHIFTQVREDIRVVNA